ncbi:MAG TPA: hypothetical protein VD902_18820 [Symbiobacteriaceae bacterium]|nr:hypothetical protein [Symbiobacteriaceae bacterium]
MNWILVGLVILAVVWAVGAMWAPASRKAPDVMNEEGLPGDFTRADHRRNDEE